MISVVVSKGEMVTAGKGVVIVISHRPNLLTWASWVKEGEGIRDVKKQQEVGITTETAKTRGNR
jgi:hypothetical protein